MKNIQRLSRFLSTMFWCLSWLIPLGTVIYILFFIEPKGGVFQSMFYSIVSIGNIKASTYSFGHRLIIVLIQVLPLSIQAIICYLLAKLFKLYEKGILFEELNIRLIRRIGFCMLIGEGIHFLYQPLMSLALSINNPPGQRFINITVGSTNATTLITAAIILLASWIVKEAQQLQSDAKYTI